MRVPCAALIFSFLSLASASVLQGNGTDFGQIVKNETLVGTGGNEKVVDLGEQVSHAVVECQDTHKE
jgi:hypothetical protein